MSRIGGAPGGAPTGVRAATAASTTATPATALKTISGRVPKKGRGE